VGLTLAAIAIYFLASLHTVILEAEPEEAGLVVNSPTALIIGDRLLALAGTYRLTVSAPGYYDEIIDLIIDTETSSALQFDLKKLPGVVIFDVEEASDSEIRVDHHIIGNGGVFRTNLEPGAHDIEIRHPRYHPMDFSLEVKGMGIEQSVPVNLKRAWANITLTSDPAGAEVIIAGESIGRTPFVAKLMPGAYEARYRLDGYEDSLQLVESDQNGDKKLPSLKLRVSRATLAIATRPNDAQVYLDGAYIGASPLHIAVPPGRTSTVKITKPGYADVSQRLALKTGELRQVAIGLKELRGTVLFRSQPQAALWVNGRHRGKTPLDLDLQTISQKIEFRLDGYRTITRIVEPQTGSPRQVSAQLLTESAALKAKARAQYQTTAGSEMLLVKPGTVRMGSAPGEIGRRPNEVSYEVALTRWFYVSKHELTQRQFTEFALTKGIRLRGNLDVPVVNISWQMAATYCNWLSRSENLSPAYKVQKGQITGLNTRTNGYRLLTEAEWAWIARAGGAVGGGQIKFPWGNAETIPQNSGNYADESARPQISKVIKDYRDKFASLAPVGQFRPNALGIFDLGGNASEWVNDYYDYSPKPLGSVEQDPVGPSQGLDHVVRGSSWRSATRELRFAYREFSSEGADDIGFRIARWLE